VFRQDDIRSPFEVDFGDWINESQGKTRCVRNLESSRIRELDSEQEGRHEVGLQAGRHTLRAISGLSPGQPGSSERNDGEDGGGRDHEIPINGFGEHFHAAPMEQESYLLNFRTDRAFCAWTQDTVQ
jgi:hypothetical protein